jgi:tRNA(Ile)-lysidine synthase
MFEMNVLCPFEQKLLTYLQKIKATHHLVLALSGGLDSKTLLHALVRLRNLKHVFDIQAIHVNHGLQDIANQWQLKCQSDCDFYQVELISTDLNLAQNCHSNIESQARDGRYQFFESSLKHNQWLLMAHHMDDQAETLLFRLLRGCGINGATAMPEQRALGKGTLLRPLLHFTQEEIRNYALKQKIDWIEDPSNQDEKYSRNFLRHKIMPSLKVKWPGYAKTLSRYADLAAEQIQLLDEVAESDLNNVRLKANELDVQSLLALSLVRQKNCLHYWGKIDGLLAPSSNEIEELIKQLGASLNHSIKINFAGLCVRSFLARLSLVAKVQPKPIEKKLQWLDITQPLLLENGIKLSISQTNESQLTLPTVHQTVWVDRRRGGEKCLADYRSKTTELKKIYQDLQVPTWEREWLPIIYFNDEIAAVPGYFIAKKFLAKPGCERISISINCA